MADSDGLRVLGLVAMLGVAFFAVRYATGASVSSSSADAGFLRSLVPSLQLRERDLGGAAEARKDFCRIFRSQRPGDTNGSVFLVTDGDGAVAGAATSPQPVIGVLAKGSGVLDNLEIEGARRAFRERLYAMLDARGMAPVAVLGLDANSPQMVSFASTVERQLTISAGMKVLEASCWFPMYAEFLQPRFVIVVSEMSRCVKVVTYAYVGNNSRGDRPTTKHTDWVCRIVTSNLLLGAAAALGSAGASKKSVVAKLDVSVERASRTQTHHVIADELGKLKALAVHGAWPGAVNAGAGARASSRGGAGARGGGVANLISP